MMTMNKEKKVDDDENEPFHFYPFFSFSFLPYEVFLLLRDKEKNEENVSEKEKKRRENGIACLYGKIIKKETEGPVDALFYFSHRQEKNNQRKRDEPFGKLSLQLFRIVLCPNGIFVDP